MKELLIPNIIENLTIYNRRTHDYGKNVRHYGTEHELRIDQIHIIDYIGRHPGCRLGSIAADTDNNLPTVSLQVKRLIKLGLINKKRSEQDQREIILNLTSEGAKAFEYHNEMDQKWISSISELLSTFDSEELSSINSFLKTLLANKPSI